MMKENIVTTLVRLAKVENAEIKQDVATALCRLSSSLELGFDMVDEGVPEALYWLTLEDLLALNKSVYLRCSVICRNVVISDDALRRVSLDSSRFSKVLERLSSSSDPDLLSNVAMVCLRITGMRESMLAFHRGKLFLLLLIIYWPVVTVTSPCVIMASHYRPQLQCQICSYYNSKETLSAHTVSFLPARIVQQFMGAGISSPTKK